MKREAEIRERLIDNAIHLIAEGGFEKATTKEMTYRGASLDGIKMNEVYIYRIFGSKEQLYEAAFLQLDCELFYAFQSAIRTIGGFEDGDVRERFYDLFNLAWKFVLKNEDRCRCYVRYYYSIYFKGHSLTTHKVHFDKTVREMASVFKAETNVAAIMHSVFTLLFDFSIRVYNGELEDDEENRYHIFNVLYCMISSYIKEPVGVS